MTLPEFYQKARVGTIFRPDVTTATEAGINAGFDLASSDQRRRLLLLVDEQVDFVHEDGSLSVPGAVEDTRRLIEWLYKNTGKITAIAASLDSHSPVQIFFPTWWVDKEGNPPDPYTIISDEDVEKGTWLPLYEEEWSMGYVQQLKERAKKDLMIWPFHTLLGTQGHTLTPALYEAMAYHSAARKAKVEFIVKGTIAKTEYYSLLEPEVKVEGDPRGKLNQDFLERLMAFDSVYIAGQAKSHCVLETITSIMRRYGDEREMVGKIHLLMDCTSSVQHAEIDFEKMAQETYAEFERKGLRLTDSTEPLE
jgi:nicotinamidase-related amidase